MEELELISPSLEYKEDALKFLEEVKITDAGLSWQYAGMARLEQYEDNYEVWVKSKEEEKHGINLPEKYVPASTYFCIRRSDNKIIGMVNIRHELNDFLLNFAGHIGQSIRPSERGKGYGKAQLLKALEKAKELGLEKVLITCDEKNIVSAKTIERCFGEYENSSINEKESKIYKRYWIDTEKVKINNFSL